MASFLVVRLEYHIRVLVDCLLVYEEGLLKPRLALYCAVMRLSGDERGHTTYYILLLLQAIGPAMASGEASNRMELGGGAGWTIAAFRFERMCFPVARQILRVASC